MAPTERDDDARDVTADDPSAPVPAVPGDEDSRALPSGSAPEALPATGDEPEQPALGPTGSPATSEGPLVDPSVELPRFVQPAHVLASAHDRDDPAPSPGPTPSEDTAGSARRGSKARTAASEWAAAPLVSGDPLLTGPNPVVSGDPLLTGPTPVVKHGDAGPDGHEPESPAAPVPPAARPVAAPPAPPMERRAAPVAPPPPPRRDPAPPPRPRTAVPPTPSGVPTGPPSGAIGGVIVPGGPNDSTSRPARRASRGSSLTTQPPTRPVARPADPSGPTATLRPTTVAPVPRMAGRRPRVRRVTRVVRHVDPWSVFKVAAVFSLLGYVIALVAGVLLWNVAYSTGTVDNIERGMESTGWSVFELKGGEIFHNAWIGGLFLAVGTTGLAVLVATLFNLITDLVGGIRFTVLEEEVIEKTASSMRRFTTRRDEPVGQRR